MTTPSPAPDSPECLSAKQAAAFLGISLNQLYEVAGRLEIPHRRIGRLYRFSRTALVRWLAGTEVE